MRGSYVVEAGWAGWWGLIALLPTDYRYWVHADPEPGFSSFEYDDLGNRDQSTEIDYDRPNFRPMGPRDLNIPEALNSGENA